MLPKTTLPETQTTKDNTQEQGQPQRRSGRPSGHSMTQPSKGELREHIAHVAQYNAAVADLLASTRSHLHDAVEAAAQLGDGEQARAIATAAAA